MKVSLDNCLKNKGLWQTDAGQITKMMSLDDMFFCDVTGLRLICDVIGCNTFFQFRWCNWSRTSLVIIHQFAKRAKENCHCAFFCSCTICFEVLPCILQLCFLFSRWAKTMYYSYIEFRWCANEIPSCCAMYFAVVHSVCQLWIVFAVVQYFPLPSYRRKDLKCVIRRRRRHPSSVPIEFPRNYISYIAAF